MIAEPNPNSAKLRNDRTDVNNVLTPTESVPKIYRRNVLETKGSKSENTFNNMPIAIFLDTFLVRLSLMSYPTPREDKNLMFICQICFLPSLEKYTKAPASANNLRAVF